MTAPVKKAPTNKKFVITEAYFHQGVTFKLPGMSRATFNQVNPERTDQRDFTFEVHSRGILMRNKKIPGYELLVPDSNIRYFVRVEESLYKKQLADKEAKK